MKLCNIENNVCQESKEYTWVEKDGYGIYLARVCDKCVDEKLKGFRPDIHERYETEEEIG